MLLKTNQINWVDEVPRWKEFSSKALWEKARTNPNVAQYFPSFSKSRLP